MKLCLSKKVLEKLNLKVGVIIAKGISNKGKVDLPKADAALSDPKVTAWKEAYKKLGVDPEKYQPSIVNLVNLGKKGLPKINKLVDIYNYISLKHVLPAGGSDLKKIKENIYIREAGKQPFTPLNSKNVEYTKPGELVYSDEEKIITRRLNWKESDFTKFTEDTKDAILELEAIPPVTDAELTIAASELAKLIEKHCGGQASYFILDKSCPTLDVGEMAPSEEFIEFMEKAEEKAPAEVKHKQLNEIEQAAVSILFKIAGLSKSEIGDVLETPPDSKLGDLAFPCFSLSKKLKKSPGEIAFELRKKLAVPKDAPFEKIEVAGPYLNFFLDKGAYAKGTILKVDKAGDKFGSSGKHKGKTALVESPSPNTNKPLHIGHMRNMALGDVVFRLFGAVGYNAKMINLINDRGVHICKSMLAYQKWGRNRQPNKKPDHFVGDFYVLYSKRAKENPQLEDEIQNMLVLWENGDKKTRSLWKKMDGWAKKGLAQTCQRFGIKHDKVYNESEYYKEGKDIVLNGLSKGVFHKNAEGAVVATLGELGEKVLLRANGTSVYTTQDIYLAKKRFADYHFDKCVYVVMQEQKYHFQALFRIFELLNYPFAKNCHHLSYGIVLSPTGKFKSREGTTADVDNILDDLHKLAETEIKKRHKLSKAKLNSLAEKIALSAAKYLVLKYDALKDFVFDPEEAISFEGNTGPYLQYALVRANKILEKAKAKPGAAGLSLLTEPEEFELVKKIAAFPEAVEQAAESYSPHVIANYTYSLAQQFSAFYEKCPVIKADGKLKGARLALVKAFAQTLKNALGLLGIEEVEMM